MNDALAHERLVGVLELIDRWGELYNLRWGKRGHAKDDSLAAHLMLKCQQLGRAAAVALSLAG